MRLPRKEPGFATPIALALIAVTGVLSVGALHDALFGEQLAGSRLLHQRAAALADAAIRDAMIPIGAAATPVDAQGDAPVRLTPTSGNAHANVRLAYSSELPDGFSAGRFLQHHFEIEGTGHVARGIRMTQVQGVVRVMPLVEEAE